MAGRARPAQPKLFTIEGANATLPYVRAIVRDAMEKWRELGRLRAELASAEAGGLPEQRSRQAREEVDRIEQGLGACVREISELGAEMKDFETGLVDFPMRHGGKTVLLCWKAGEEGIEHWHDLESGFAGRRPIGELGARG